MMLHRHFERESANENMTTAKDLEPKAQQEDFVSEIFPPEPEEKAPARRTRRRTTEEK